MEFVRATGIEVPTGRMPVNEIADGLASIRATMTDFADFLKDYAGRWIGAPATWTHVLVSFRRWAAFHRFAHPITKYSLEFSVFYGEGRTKKDVPLTKALDYGWACNINGTIQYGKGGNRS